VDAPADGGRLLEPAPLEQPGHRRADVVVLAREFVEPARLGRPVQPRARPLGERHVVPGVALADPLVLQLSSSFSRAYCLTGSSIP
jgi:hypothetical protein